MKKQTLFLLSAIALLSCQNQKAENPKPAPTELAVDQPLPAPKPTATNSMDYLGFYKGTLPCADCEGIETSIELSEDFTYAMMTRYKGKGTKVFEGKGVFQWDDTGKKIILTEKGKVTAQFLVSNNALTQLDASGNKITGQLASRYVLKRMSDAAVEKLPEPKQELQTLVGIKWKLAELNGYKVQQEGDKPYYIELDAMNAFTGFAGCNNLRGHYEARGGRIRFMRIVGTMKGCPALPTEEKFKTILSRANAFAVDGKSLKFMEGETLLATFEPMAK